MKLLNPLESDMIDLVKIDKYIGAGAATIGDCYN